MTDVDIDSQSKESLIDYLRNKYGKDSVCLIGTSTNFSGANLLQDLGRVYDIDKDEILYVTKSMAELDKDEVKNASVDELAKKCSPLAKLIEKYPQLKMPFNELRGNTVTYGVHASGVLVSDKSLTDMLPVRMSKDGISTCWHEGIEGRELGQMGFVKMDFLEVKAMTFIEEIIKLINERYNFERIRDDYMLDSYLNDKKAFDVANKGDLLGIWQLDSSVAKGVIRDMGGIHSFSDISAVNSLMRPASLKNKFPKKFGDRRSGEESFTIPKCLQKYLGSTYGLPIFQEAAYHVAYHLAGFNNVKSYKFMKLLYKSKMTEDIIPYWREEFVKGCQPKVDSGEISKDYPESIFNELLAFSGYGFNECLDIHSLVELVDGTKKELKDVVVGDIIKSANNKYHHLPKDKFEWYTDKKNIVYVKVKNIYHNKKQLYQITTHLGKKIIASLDHKFKVCTFSDNTYRMKPLSEILDVHSYNLNHVDSKEYYRFVTEDGEEIIDYDDIKPCGELPTIDLEVEDENHQFFANGILVSNSHSVAYSMYSALDLFFKANYKKEFTCCLLNHYNRTEEIDNMSAIKYLINYSRKHGIKVFPPDINTSENKWVIENNGIYEGLRFPLRDMMLLNQVDINNIIEKRPYNNFDDFYEKIGNRMNDKKLEHLICSGAFNHFGEVTVILERWNQVKNKKNLDQLDLFGFDDFANEEPVLTIKEQKEREEAMLNYVFEPTISEKYDKFIEEFNKKAKANGNMLLKTMDEVESGTAKFRLVLAQVDKLAFFTTKSGDKKCWVLLSDGLNNAKLLVGEDDVRFTYSNYFKPGNILQIPIMVSETDRQVYFFNKNSTKAEFKIII